MSDNDSEINRLLEKYLSQTMSEKDIETWLRYCQTRPELPERLFDHFMLDEMLRDLSRGGQSNSSLAQAFAEVIEHRNQPWRFLVRQHPILLPISVLTLASLIFLAFWLFQSMPQHTTDPQTAPIAVQHVVSEHAVAVLEAVANPRWNESQSWKQGDRLTAGTLFLQSGLAKIRFHSGAVVLLEGPAEFQLISADRGACRQGRLSAVVPPEAVGFRIDLNQYHVIDLGTAFSVEMTEYGAELQVLQGRVALSGPNMDNQILERGIAVRWNVDSPARRFHADLSRLKGVESLAQSSPDRLETTYDETRKESTVASDRVLLPNCRVIAQRGSVKGFPENTIGAFRAAAAMGVDACELDVVAASDGTLFVAHPGSSKTPYSQLSPEKINQIGRQIPKLDEALAFFREKTSCFVVIDVFEAGTEQGILNAIDRSGIADRIILTGRYPDRVAVLKKLRPSVCVGWCCDLTSVQVPASELAEAIRQKADTIHADFVKLEYSLLSRELHDDLRRHGLPIWAWTVDSELEMRYCLSADVAGILTCRSDLLLKLTHTPTDGMPVSRPERRPDDKTSND